MHVPFSVLLLWDDNINKVGEDISIRPPLVCLFSGLFKLTSKKTSNLCVTGHCEGKPQVTDGFPLQRISRRHNASLSLRGFFLTIFWKAKGELIIIPSCVKDNHYCICLMLLGTKICTTAHWQQDTTKLAEKFCLIRTGIDPFTPRFLTIKNFW